MPHETVSQAAARSALPQPRAAALGSAGQSAPEQAAALAVSGLRKSYGEKVVLDGIDLHVADGHGLRAARPERRRQDDHRAHPVHADPGRRRPRPVAGHDVAARPDAVRAAIGVTGQFSAVDGLLTGRENLLLMADLRHLGKAEGRRRAAELLEQFDLVEAAGKPRATYSGGMRRRLDLAMTLVGAAAGDLPGRADHRPRPAQPPHHVADHPRAGRRRRDRSSSPPSTSRRPTSSPTGSRCSTTAGIVAEGTPAELKRLVPGGHIRLRFADAARPRRARPRRAATRSAATTSALTLQVPERRRGRARCAPCSTASTRPASRSTSCPSTPPTSTTCSSP